MGNARVPGQGQRVPSDEVTQRVEPSLPQALPHGRREGQRRHRLRRYHVVSPRQASFQATGSNRGHARCAQWRPCCALARAVTDARARTAASMMLVGFCERTRVPIRRRIEPNKGWGNLLCQSRAPVTDGDGDHVADV